MAEQCCCGKYKPLSEPLIVNDYLHEPYGEPGAFCSSVQTHELHDLREKVTSLESSHAELLGVIKWVVEECDLGPMALRALTRAIDNAEEPQ